MEISKTAGKRVGALMILILLPCAAFSRHRVQDYAATISTVLVSSHDQLIEREKYRVGEQVLVKVAMVSDATKTMNVPKGEDYYRPQLFRNGQLVNYRKEVAERVEKLERGTGSRITGFLFLKPHERQADTIDLSYWYEPLEIGRYQLSLQRIFFKQRVLSNAVFFEIVPPVTRSLPSPGIAGGATQKPTSPVSKEERVTAATPDGLVFSAWVMNHSIDPGRDIVIYYKVDNHSRKTIHLVHDNTARAVIEDNAIIFPRPFVPVGGHEEYNYNFTKVARGDSYSGQLSVSRAEYKEAQSWRVAVGLGYVTDIRGLTAPPEQIDDPAPLKSLLASRLQTLQLNGLSVEVLRPQAGTVAGGTLFVDEKEKRRLGDAPNVTLELEHKKRILTIVSDDKGDFAVKLPKGNYRLKSARNADRRPLRFSPSQYEYFQVKSNQDTRLDVMLLRPPTVEKSSARRSQ